MLNVCWYQFYINHFDIMLFVLRWKGTTKWIYAINKMNFEFTNYSGTKTKLKQKRNEIFAHRWILLWKICFFILFSVLLEFWAIFMYGRSTHIWLISVALLLVLKATFYKFLQTNTNIEIISKIFTIKNRVSTRSKRKKSWMYSPFT